MSGLRKKLDVARMLIEAGTIALLLDVFHLIFFQKMYIFTSVGRLLWTKSEQQM
jgi:hypothetical protein